LEELEMTKINQTELKKDRQPSKGPVVQQFASGGSAVPTPELPYDVEKARSGDVKPSPKP
jgi:hypothetical protein